ncbi:exodeoxyribonuclease VII large subunit [Terriglobus roseus]|uniref:Exodeoxyribonuclease 7 large subunit n=1 Tax=Terriglobus roseus TaxID=392734 RepID=A0A1H4MJ24_9BACT|nr:exodeoxyribonuclease VII large subunit [Terriglobus roseus]SEB83110.1 Exodeoxyribonuclease VII large subunit [Terriglobus roseus]
MAAPENPPASLAQFIRRRAAAGRSSGPPSSLKPKPDKLGQFGLLFSEPESATEDGAVTVADVIAERERIEAPASPAQVPQQRKLWAVAELVSALRGKVEREYSDVWVEGEISNCRPAPSGHLYFTLKDGNAQLLVVLFRREASLLRFKPTDGLAVLARGRISVFESRGQLQLIAETLEPRGAGALQLAFEQLKAKLRAEGLFEQERKRPLPAFPRTVGVITSTQGAVLRDIVTVVRRRHACLDILVFPAAMQGVTCAPDVIRGLRYLNANPQHNVDVIVIARGGGSAEDLAGFNDEALARAIAAIDLPVVSAVGHETDFTIADFVADLRAPTPSAAAELVTAAQHRVEERVQSLAARLFRAMRYQQMHAQQRFTRVSAASAFARMRDSIGRRQQRVDQDRFRLEAATEALLRERAARLRLLTERLQRQDVHRSVLRAQTKNERLRERLLRAGSSLLTTPSRRVARAETRLHALSPTAVLQRGYALVFNGEGRLLRSAKDVTAGDEIRTRLGEGEVRSRVLSSDVNGNTGTGNENA